MGDRVERAPGQGQGSRGTSGDWLHSRHVGLKEQRTTALSLEEGGVFLGYMHPQGSTMVSCPY